MQVWFLASAWKRARSGKIWSRFQSAPADGRARGDLARLLPTPPVLGLATQPGAMLILCDRIDPDLLNFQAHFVHTAICLVTGNPALADAAPPGITVACGDIGDRRWLRSLAAFHGPNLIIDQRRRGALAQAWALTVLHGALARGGVYAVRARAFPGERRAGPTPLNPILERRFATAGLLPAEDDPNQRRAGYRLFVKTASGPTPIRVRPAAEIPAPPAVTIAAPTYRRPLAEIVDAPSWIDETVAHYAGLEVTPPEARVYRYRDAVVFGYGIVQIGDAIVDESLINRDRTDFLGALSLQADGTGQVHHTLPGPRRIAGRTVHLWQMWGENYGHWLIECLPRLHIAQRAGLLDGANVTVQASIAMEPIYRQSLAVLGIGPERIVRLNHREVVFEELVYPTPVTRQPFVKSPLVIDAAFDLRDRIGPPPVPLSERIYVSRNRTGRRRLANEDAVIALLRERGYRVVHPETESFARQVQIFAAARLVVGSMGAALSNLAFAPQGVRCLMLTNRDMLDDFFLDLVGLKEGTYVSLHGTSLSPDQGMHSDYTIAIDTLRVVLDRHGL
ncbi:hypothetical protein CFIICLFH_0419 [Methylobacterium goesingense]|nr:hypothetical protein CFIICLFH_0419 [Methylobacterium goesingense]